MNRTITFFLAISGLLLFSFLLAAPVNEANAQGSNAPTFGALGPCPSCETPSLPPVQNSNITPPVNATTNSTYNSIPGAPNAPCDPNAAPEKSKKSKHKKHNGAISKGMSELLELLVKFFQLLLELLGGSGNINQNQNAIPQDSDTDQKDPQDEEQNNDGGNDDGGNDDGDDAVEDPLPCPPAGDSNNNPTDQSQQTTQPSQPVTSQQPHISGQPQPSGGAPAAGAQKPGCGGAPAAANAEQLPANGTITTSGTAGSPKVYDGACKQVGRITIKANYVTVQNFMIVANSQYGIQSEGTGITIQNNDIKGVKPTGDGDLNAITFFGNDTKILYNTAIDFVSGNPGGSHTDAIQTWISSSHPTGSTNVIIKGNKFTGPQNPSRDNSIPSIHQCIMAEGPGKGGNSGGSGTSSNWLIADNYFLDSWNQCIKLDGINNVTITRNEFAGSSDKVMDLPSSTAKYYSDNKVTGQYKNGVGTTVTQGAGPTDLPGGTAPQP